MRSRFQNLFNKHIWSIFVARIETSEGFLQKIVSSQDYQFLKIFGGISQQIGYDYKGFSKALKEEIKVLVTHLLSKESHSSDKQKHIENQSNESTGHQIEEEGQENQQQKDHTKPDLVNLFGTQLVQEFLELIEFVNEVVVKLFHNHSQVRKMKIQFFEFAMNCRAKRSFKLDHGLLDYVCKVYFHCQDQWLRCPEDVHSSNTFQINYATQI